jgi:hypothetical protein
MSYYDRLNPYGQLQKNPDKVTLPDALSVSKAGTGQMEECLFCSISVSEPWGFIHD